MNLKKAAQSSSERSRKAKAFLDELIAEPFTLGFLSVVSALRKNKRLMSLRND